MRDTLRMMSAIVALAAMACGEHDPDGPGPGDHTPPGLVAALAWDATHVEIVFDEPVSRWSAENPSHYHIADHSPRLESSPAGSGVPTNVSAAALHDDLRTVTLTTDAMVDRMYKVQVAGVADAHGNEIANTAEHIFTGSEAADTSPPQVVYRQPQPDATGIAGRTFVAVGFTEAVDLGTFSRGLRVQGAGAQKGAIRYDDLLRFTCDVDSLQPGASYTVILTGVEDLAGNVLPDVQWTFSTGTSPDVTPPSVVSSYPANRAFVADLDTDLSLTFSEPMDPYSLIVRPPITSSAMRWLDAGRRVRFDTTWLSGAQYTVQIRPGEMRDHAGNRSTNLFTLTFGVGVPIAPGSFGGRITGDPRASSRAHDPTGGLAFAGTSSAGNLHTSVAAMTRADDTYEIPHLPDGTYYPFYVMDSDGNGIYQPKYGDAVGVYSVVHWPAPESRTVTVAGDRVTGVNIQVNDPSAVCGLLSYSLPAAPIRVGLFDLDGFDPSMSAPVVAVTAVFDGVWDYVVNTLDTGPVADGSYYVAAFVDYDEDFVYDPSSEAIGVYGGATPIGVDVSGGKDTFAANFALSPPTSTVTAGVRWPDAPRSTVLQRVVEMLAATDTP